MGLRPPETASLISVHVGSEKVATLDPDQTEETRADMDLARNRGQVPAVEARLTKQTYPPGYRLELGAPARPSRGWPRTLRDP